MARSVSVPAWKTKMAVDQLSRSVWCKTEESACSRCFFRLFSP